MAAPTHARRATTLPDDGTPMDSRPNHVDRRPTVPEEHDYDSTVPQPKTMSTPKLYLIEGEAQAFRHLAHSIVSRTLAHECEFRQLGCPEPNSKEWKLLKRQDDLSVYKQRGSSDSKTYTVKCVGSLEGTVFTQQPHGLRRAQCSRQWDDEDPYRQLALKWFIAETFGDARLVKHRDWFNIESTGMGTDTWGRRFGYFLAKFVDHPGCPPMPEDSDVIRGKMAMCCIYRQEPGSKIVDVYAKGSIDLGGGMPAFITSSASCAMMFNMAVSMESAESKRLTKLALQHAQREAKEKERKAEAEEEDAIERSQKLTTESVIDLLAASVISSSTTSSNEGKMKASKATRVPCHVCGKKPVMSKFVRSSHRKCGICKERACSKCNIKRKLFGRAGPVTVSCCKVCILESKRLSIDPREPCPILP
ncbi:hypothetical protein GN244_ATG00676 [Phytophthora infestans]|uniref:FYVE-type domain-containing protein n=1 Tax=Phytophthora infestans TaxID=4787 RepID=A0A833W8Q1_PHYIN|nr:hypothetical protein GN244_ATG00676 [Phytophthora infestans]